jgi:hypothetical protein
VLVALLVQAAALLVQAVPGLLVAVPQPSQPVRSDAGRQSHPFFFSKKVPCADDYKQKVHRLHITQIKTH